MSINQHILKNSSIRLAVNYLGQHTNNPSVFKALLSALIALSTFNGEPIKWKLDNGSSVCPTELDHLKLREFAKIVFIGVDRFNEEMIDENGLSFEEDAEFLKDFFQTALICGYMGNERSTITSTFKQLGDTIFDYLKISANELKTFPS